MTDDIEVFSGGVSVRPPGGVFKQFLVPKGFSEHTFRKALSAYDFSFRYKGALPDVDELHKQHPSIPKKTFAALLLTKEFRDALAYRGIEVDPESGLTIEQQHVLVKLSDPTDVRSLATKLKELGVPMPRYQAWLKQPLFKAALEKATTEAYEEYLPLARNALIGKVLAGDMAAIKLMFEKTGEYNPQQQQLQDARQLVIAIVESVTRHVQDREVLEKVMADVQMHAGVLRVMGQREIGS